MAFNGLKFHIGDFLLVDENVAVKITQIFVSEINDIAVLSFDLHSLEFDNNLQAYEIGDEFDNDMDFICNFNSAPLSHHSVAQRNFLLKNI